MGEPNSFLIVVLAVLGVLGAGIALATHPKGGSEPTLAQKMIIFIKTALPGAYLLGKGIRYNSWRTVPGHFSTTSVAVSMSILLSQVSLSSQSTRFCRGLCGWK